MYVLSTAEYNGSYIIHSNILSLIDMYVTIIKQIIYSMVNIYNE